MTTVAMRSPGRGVGSDSNALDNELCRFNLDGGQNIQRCLDLKVDDAGNMVSAGYITSPTFYGTVFDTNIAAAGVTLSGTTLAADGTDAAIDINLTPKGTGILNVAAGSVFQNAANSVTAYQWLDAAGASVVNVNTTNERVGIRTATPAYTLDVGGDIRAKAFGHQIRIHDTDSATDEWTISTFSNEHLSFWENGSTVRMILSNDGNLGLGTSIPPTFQLDVQGNSALVRVRRFNEAATSSPGFLFERAKGTKASPDNIVAGTYLGKNQFRGRVSGSYIDYGFFGMIASDTSQNGYYTFQDSSLNNRFIILTTGNIGINETAPETLLEMTSTVPYFTSHNSTEENIEGGRECIWKAKGEKQDATEHTLGEMQFSHDGTGDDYLADFILSVNQNGGADTLVEVLRIDSAGNMGLSLTAPTARLHLPAGTAAASTAPLKFTAGTALTTPEVGVMEFHNDRFYITNVATRRSIDRSCDVATTTTSVSNTTTETVIFTCPSAANSYKDGNHLHIEVSGIISNNSAADDITIRTYVGAQLINTYNPAMGNLTNADWHVDLTTTIRTVGAAGTIASHGHVVINGNEDVANELDTIDTTGSNDITITVEWDNAKVDNIISLYEGASHWRN